MRTALKVCLWFFSIIIAGCIAIALILHFTIHPDTYKKLINQAVFESTGHKMQINGALKWAIFPEPSIQVNKVLIENKEDTSSSSPYFAKINKASISLSLFPLISGKVKPSQITLDGGDFNISYHGKSQKKSSKKTSLSTSSINAKKSSQGHASHYKTPPNITVKNTTINLINLKNNTKTTLNNINLSIKPGAETIALKGNISVLHNKQNVTFKFLGAATNKSLAISKYTLNWNKLPITGTFKSTWASNAGAFISNYNLTSNISKGTLVAKGQFKDQTKGADSFNGNFSLKNCAIYPILKALNYGKLLKGTLTLSANLNANNANGSWIRNLNGNGKFNLQKAILLKINAANLLKHSKQSGNATSFKSATGTFTIKKGILNNPDLKLDANKLSSVGNGSVNLVNKTLNYRLTLTSENKLGIQIGLIISGDLHNPKVHVDIKKIGKSLINNLIKKRSFKGLFRGKTFLKNLLLGIKNTGALTCLGKKTRALIASGFLKSCFNKLKSQP